VRVQEAVGTCIGSGGGRAFRVVWVSVSILDSESPSSPQDACGTFESAAHSPGGAERIGVGDHVNGFELPGSEGPPRWIGCQTSFWQEVGALSVITKYFWCGATDISTQGSNKIVREMEGSVQ